MNSINTVSVHLVDNTVQMKNAWYFFALSFWSFARIASNLFVKIFYWTTDSNPDPDPVLDLVYATATWETALLDAGGLAPIISFIIYDCCHCLLSLYFYYTKY